MDFKNRKNEGPAVTYTLVPKVLPGKEDGQRLYYAQSRARGELGLEEMAERISRNCTLTRSDIIGVLAALEEGISLPAAWRQGFAALSGEGGRILRRLEPEGDEQRILGELTWAAGELTELRRGLGQESRQREKLWFAGLFSGAGLLLILLI